MPVHVKFAQKMEDLIVREQNNIIASTFVDSRAEENILCTYRQN